MIYLVASKDDKRVVLEAVEKLDAEKKYRVEISQLRKQRSKKQLGLYWIWMRYLSDYSKRMLGQDMTPQEFDEFYKKKFIPDKGKMLDGVTVAETKHFSSLDTKEGTEYLDNVRLHAGEFFCVELPLPDSTGWDNLIARYGHAVH